MRRSARTDRPCENGCAAASEALDRLPETDARGRPHVAALWVGLGARALLAKELKLARRFARRALQLEEVFPAAFNLLARAAYAESDFDEAEKYWERAARGSSEPGEIRYYRQQLEQVARDRVTFGRGRKASEHFIVLYDPQVDEAAAQIVLDALESARSDVGAMFGSAPPLVTVALHSGLAFERMRHTAWAAGFYDGRVRIPSGGLTSASLNFKQLLFHEFAHGVFDHASGGQRGPGWLNEGLAQVAEGFVAPHPAGTCQVGHAVPLRSLEGSFGALQINEARNAYAEAHHAAERLRASFGAQGIRALFGQMAKRKNFGEAFESALGVSYARWAEQFDAEGGR